MMDYEIRFFIDDFATLDHMGQQLVMAPTVGDKGRWFWHFRKGLHGMTARVFAVGQHYNAVHGWEKRPRSMFQQRLENEYHISVILFAMDSALECFVYTLNALGYAITTPAPDFRDITDASALRLISPNNITGGGPKQQKNPLPGYARLFPQVTTHWLAHPVLLGRIIEHHDVNKHRAESGGGWSPRTDPPPGFYEEAASLPGVDTSKPNWKSAFHVPSTLYLKEDPKAPTAGASSLDYTLESLVIDFKGFIDRLLPFAAQDIQASVLSKLPAQPNP